MHKTSFVHDKSVPSGILEDFGRKGAFSVHPMPYRHLPRVRGDQGGNQRCEVCGVGELRMKKNETMKNEGCLGGEWNKMYFCRVDKGSVFIVKLPMRAVLAIPRNSPIYSGFFLRSKAVGKNGHFPFAFPRSPSPTRAILGENKSFSVQHFSGEFVL